MGIAKEELPRLFKAFEQTRSGVQTLGGTGLGLAISQSHAHLLGGVITVTSALGAGSCFHVKLAVEASPEAVAAASKPAKQAIGLKAGTRQIKLLIVDDRLENRLVLQEFLDPVGISTRTAEDGLAAIEMTEQWKPDIVLMDLRMPRMGGVEASRRIKALEYGPQVEIIAVTASALELDKNLIAEAGMTGYLQKPFKESELFSLLEEKLGEIFIYRQVEPAAQDRLDAPANQPVTQLLRGIPADLLDRIANATINAHFDLILQLAEETAVYSPEAAVKLRDLASSFQYEAILKLLDQ